LNVSIHSLDDLVRVISRTLADWKRKGCVGLKISEAYARTLNFEKVTRDDAERVFNRTFEHLGEGLTLPQAKPLVDYLIHAMILIAGENDITVIIHTGLHAGGKNIIENANPTLLTNLFLEYRDIRFDVFHCGYPYVREAGVQAKYFPNVCVNFCWLNIISPRAAREAFSEYLEIVPSNKIIGFGGDLSIVEKVYGHLVMAKRNIAWALAEKIEEGYLSENDAVTLARKFLYDNPKNFYKLNVSK
jgi:predicted TIM-barrel fold metal-dependent hydrolase